PCPGTMQTDLGHGEPEASGSRFFSFRVRTWRLTGHGTAHHSDGIQGSNQSMVQTSGYISARPRTRSVQNIHRRTSTASSRGH
ncbi:Neurofibromin, partial [Dissostichus eleginoides]